MRLLAKILGALLSVCAMLGVLASVHALVDPVEAQLSNDANPFGTPPSVGESWSLVAVWLLALGIGLWLFFRRRARVGCRLTIHSSRTASRSA